MFVYETVDKPPTFPGGDVELGKYLMTNLHYPKEQNDCQETLRLSFVIDTAGNILNKCIQNKNESAYSLLDKEGIRLLNEMPKWKPGMQNGRKVAVRFYLPMHICLQE